MPAINKTAATGRIVLRGTLGGTAIVVGTAPGRIVLRGVAPRYVVSTISGGGSGRATASTGRLVLRGAAPRCSVSGKSGGTTTVTVTVALSRGIGQSFDAPFFTGSPQVSSDVPNYFQVALAGQGFVIDPAKYQRVTVPLQRQSTDESVEPGEQTLNTGGAWRRSQDNWFLGAGQEYLDNRFAFVSVYVHSGEDPSVRTRFWRSKGINPWVEGALTLLPEQEQKAEVGADSQCITVGPYLYLWDGTNLKYTANPSLASPVFTDVATPVGGSWPAIQSMTTDGANLYLALGTHGIASTVGGTDTATIMRPTGPTPTVTPNGTPGSTSYEYAIVGTDAAGFKTLVSPFTTTATGNGTLTTDNFNEIAWEAVEGIVSYDVLRADSTHSIALGLTGTSYTDDGSAIPATYVPPTVTTDNFQADFVSYGNTFLVAGAGPNLCQVGANGTCIQIMQHFNPSFQWNCGGGSEVAIYVAGSAGNISELYGIQLSTTTFGLGAPFIAGQVGNGEIINAIAYYQGLVILATSLGIRATQDTNSNGFLTSGPVIEDLGPSLCLASYGPYVWFGTSDYSEEDGIWPGTAQSSGTGRLFLSEFSNPLIPAYASDVLALDGNTGTTTSVAIWGGQPYFTIDGNGLWGPESHGYLVEQGYLESGYVRYGTVEDKILVSVDVRHDPLQGTVEVQVAPFGGEIFSTPPSNQQGSVGPPESINAGNYVGEAYQIIPVLTRSTTDFTKGPVLRRWTCRAMVIAVRQTQFVVPIIWADRVETPMGDGQPLYQDLGYLQEFLDGLVVSGGPFVYQEGAQIWTCYVDQLELDPNKGWNDTHTYLQGTQSVKLLSVN